MRFALAAQNAGARAFRIEGIANVAAVAAACSLPIIGLVKRDLQDTPVRITPWIEDIHALSEAGAAIIAFDATDRQKARTSEQPRRGGTRSGVASPWPTSRR